MLLLPMLWQHPKEFAARIVAIADSKSEKYLHPPVAYQGTTLQQTITRVDTELGWKIGEYMAEPACQAITQQTQQAIHNLPPNVPFTRKHNSDFSLAQSCYAFCRMLKPRVVVETGVAYGVTSSFILAALEENQAGKLYSIDLPPLAKDADDFVGMLVPNALRGRWQLMRGASRHLLPDLVKSVGPIDIFIHDSLHTYRNITFELDTVMPFTNRPAAILVDDAGMNGAFADWQKRNRSADSYVIHEEEKDALFGIALFNRQ